MNARNIAVALGILIIGLGMWQYLSRSDTQLTPAPVETATSTVSTTTAPQQTTTSQPKKTVTTPTVPATRKPLLLFLSGTQSTKCSYETVTDAARTSSVLFMSKGVLRGEFRTWNATSASTDFVHYDGSYVYTWKEGTSSGTKRVVATLADLPALIPRDLTGGSVLGTATNNASWDCHQWIVESAKMTLPTYVSFK